MRIYLDDSEWESLAVEGVCAKRKRKLERLREEKRLSKSTYPMDIGTTDIDNFIKNTMVFQKAERSDLSGEKFKILNDTIKTCKTPMDKSKSFLVEATSTVWYRCAEFISRIVEEVNISRQRFTSREEFVIKHLSPYPAALLIKPTKPSGPIFFSILILSELPFIQWNKHGQVWTTRFYSLDQNRISHLLHSEQKMSLLLATFCQLFESVLPMEKYHSDDIRQHFLFSILVYLEDKEITSRNLSLVRYFYMEFTRGSRLQIDPMKVLNKADDFLRSSVFS